MPTPLLAVRPDPFRRAALICAGVAATLAATALAGWALHLGLLRTLVPDAVSMKANTAVCLLLLSGALALDVRRGDLRGARLLSRAAATLAAATLAQWVLDVDLGIDELLFDEPWASAGTPQPGRMAVNTSLAIMLVALSLPLGRTRRHALSSAAAVAAIVAAFAVLVGHLVGAPSLVGLPGFTQMALPTAVAILLLAGGSLLARPEAAPVRLLTSPAAGGRLARRLLPTAALVPVAVDLARQAAVDQGIVGSEAAHWLYVVCVTLVLSVVTARLAHGLEGAHRRRLRAEERLLASESLSRSVIDAATAAIVGSDGAGTITLFNPAAERLFGRCAADTVGAPVTLLLPARLQDAPRSWREELSRRGTGPLTGRTVEATGVAADGREFLAELSFAAAGSGSEHRFVTIVRDVTESRRQEQATREDAERLGRVVRAQEVIAAATGGIDDVMTVVAAEACEIVGAGGAMVELPDGDQLVYRAVAGSAGPHLGTRVPIEGSLAGRALADGATAHCHDIELDTRVDRDACRRMGIRCMIVVPLRHRREIVGVLKVVASVPEAFTEHDVRTLELLAGLGGAAVSRAQSEQQLATHHEVSRAIADAGSLSEGVPGVLRALGRTLGWDVAALWLVPEDGDELRCQDVWHRPDGAAAPYAGACRAGRPRMGEGVLGEVLDSGRPSWLDDTAGAAWALDAPRAQAARGAGIRTIVHVPVLANGVALGVLELAARERHARHAGTAEVLAVVAAQVGQFVQRKRAQGRVAGHAQNLGAVVELSHAVSRLRDPELVRPTLCAAIRDVTGADQVVLFEPVDGERLIATSQVGDRVPVGAVLDAAGTSAVGQAFRSGVGVYVADAAVDPRVDAELARTSGLRSAYVEPLLRDDAVLGTVSISWHTVQRTDPAELASLIRLLVAEMASALERADLVAALDARARTDKLTGLANRRAWDEGLPPELARAGRSDRPLSVAMVDLDHFKAFNDAHGHQAGDRLLREAAAGWQERLRATDLLSRYGGEEFALALPGCDQGAALAVLDELRRGMPHGATCSIGFAQWDGSETPEALVARADAALYEAKRTGRDRVVAAVPSPAVTA